MQPQPQLTFCESQTSPRSSLVNIFSNSRHSGISASRLWNKSRVFSLDSRPNDSGSSAS